MRFFDIEILLKLIPWDCICILAKFKPRASSALVPI